MQIEDLPPSLTKYYPDEYYSFGAGRDGLLRRSLKALRARAVFGDRNLVGRLLLRRFGTPPALRAVQRAPVKRDAAILDVGCGAGHLLLYLHGAGFTNLTGSDPFIPEDIEPEPGVRLLRRDLDEIVEQYDLIMLHHSIEHMLDPRIAMKQVARLLRPGGRVLVRTPVAGSFAARTYGADWVQLDSPRHITILSESGLRILSREVGLAVDDVVYDSDGFQFWGSEQYRRDIPLISPSTVAGRPHDGQFTSDELASFEARASELNARGDGDQACYYLSKAST